MRISITFRGDSDLNPAIRRGIETAILTPAEAETCVWIGNRLTYRTRRPPEEVMSDWEIHGFGTNDFASVHIAPWVERRSSEPWPFRERRIHR
ncbi:hypothetical protein [Paracoccus laeviglucosivorans]|uniref:Uncharacterized protein n=1 Tax=Paracoccus laeviglucosivorans TaxID=1197861 RepID=A0A521F0Y8_9RHOB|nr:hypothetical protein [Paracoccus laeviglucosivorans]SMO89874.1 hypothetical protein SAMN06265221_11748 [Paracoccus laeviglucosivorans]